jgi:putative transcriptional regulator
MFKWHLKKIMVERGLWTGQELLDLLEQKAGVIISHTAVMQLIKQEPKAFRLQTLEALCIALECSPWDLIEYIPFKTNREQALISMGKNSVAVRPYAKKIKPAKKSLKSIYPDEEF